MGKLRKPDSAAGLKAVPFLRDEEDEVERCRRVRREIDARFDSLDQMFSFFSKMDRERIRKGAASNVRKKAASKSNDVSSVKQKRKATKG